MFPGQVPPQEGALARLLSLPRREGSCPPLVSRVVPVRVPEQVLALIALRCGQIMK